MERKLMIIKTLNEAEIAFEDISSQLRHFVKLVHRLAWVMRGGWMG